MKIVLKILGGIGSLVAALLLLIILCHFNPSIAKNLGKVVNSVVPAQTQTNVEPVRTGENEPVTVQILTPDATVEGIVGQELEGLLPEKLQGLYEIPAIEDLKIDTLVLQLNGLEEIKDVGETIPKEKVQEIEKEVSYGETGEGLDWDGEMYPYYAMLNDSAKALYRQIYANMEGMNKSFRPIHDTNKNELKNAFTAVCNDQPQLFFVKTGYGYKQDMAGKIAQIDLAFYFDENQIDDAKEKFDDCVESIVEMANAENSNFNKEVAVHDELMDQVTYQLSAPMNQSAYSALVNGKTVCAGYARAFQYICMKMGIPCYYCTGYAGEKHAWNIIKLEDDFYNVDVTWDDTEPHTHDYFNCSDAKYAKDHARREMAVYLPPCNGEKYADLIVDPKLEPVINGEDADNAEVEKETKSEEPIVEEKNDEKEVEQETENEENVIGGEVSKEKPVQEEKVDLEKTVETVEEYYKLCRANLMANDKDEMTFIIKVKDKILWQDIRRVYQNEEYKDGYAQQVLKDKSKDVYNVELEMKRLTGGVYQLTHKVSLE